MYLCSLKLEKNMKKTMLLLMLLATATMVSADDVMRKEKDGTYIVNTTTLAQDVEGYNGATPVEVHIKKDRIVKVVLLKSQETPKYKAIIKKSLLPKYEGQNVKKGGLQEVDAVSGATFTSDAVKENVRRAVEYYQKHR